MTNLPNKELAQELAEVDACTKDDKAPTVFCTTDPRVLTRESPLTSCPLVGTTDLPGTDCRWTASSPNFVGCVSFADLCGLTDRSGIRRTTVRDPGTSVCVIGRVFVVRVEPDGLGVVTRGLDLQWVEGSVVSDCRTSILGVCVFVVRVGQLGVPGCTWRESRWTTRCKGF